MLASLLLLSCSGNKIDKADVEGIWFLKEIEGEEAAYLFGGGLPTLNFRWDDQKIYGTGGCNRYVANYKIEGNDIKIDSLVLTEVFCENIEIEKRFVSLLEGAAEIKVENISIVFGDRKKIFLKFLKLDLSPEAETK